MYEGFFYYLKLKNANQNFHIDYRLNLNSKLLNVLFNIM